MVATGTLTVTMVCTSKGKMLILSQTLNLASGKESVHQTGFSDAAWGPGKATCSYAISAHSLTNIKFDAIIQEVQEFMKLTHTCNKTMEATDIININEDDEHTLLVDNSDSDIECKSVVSLPKIYQHGILESAPQFAIQKYIPTRKFPTILVSLHALAHHHARFNSGTLLDMLFSVSSIS